MGPSGSGKSTLMNIIGCLDSLTTGKYILNNKDVSSTTDNDLAEVRNKEIGFVFQQFNLLPRLTAEENVAIPLVYAGIAKKERIERTKTSVEIMNLFGELHAQGNTVILVTHEDEISKYAHRIVRLKDGVVETDKKNELITLSEHLV